MRPRHCCHFIAGRGKSILFRGIEQPGKRWQASAARTHYNVIPISASSDSYLEGIIYIAAESRVPRLSQQYILG